MFWNGSTAIDGRSGKESDLAAAWGFTLTTAGDEAARTA
jgi:hypothetical protein